MPDTQTIRTIRERDADDEYAEWAQGLMRELLADIRREIERMEWWYSESPYFHGSAKDGVVNRKDVLARLAAFDPPEDPTS